MRIKRTHNFIERFLAEECRTLTWLSRKVDVPYSTLYYKIAKRSDSELMHTLTYAEFVAIENLISKGE